MVKKISFVLAVIMILACMLAACGGKEESDNSNSIVGTWSAESDEVTGVYEFKADGTGSAKVDGMSLELTYTVDEDKLCIVIDGTSILENAYGMKVNDLIGAGIITQADANALYETIEATFEVNGDALIIDGETFTKVN